MKLGLCVYYPKSNRNNLKCIFFFSELCPFFRLAYFILYQAPQSQVLGPTCRAFYKPLPHCKNVNLTKLKASADDNLNVAKIVLEKEKCWVPFFHREVPDLSLPGNFVEVSLGKKLLSPSLLLVNPLPEDKF